MLKQLEAASKMTAKEDKAIDELSGTERMIGDGGKKRSGFLEFNELSGLA